MAGNFKKFSVTQFGFSRTPNGTKELLLTAVLHKYCVRLNLIICIERLFNNIEPKQILFLMNENAKSLTMRSRICRIIYLLNIYGALMFSMLIRPS